MIRTRDRYSMAVVARVGGLSFAIFAIGVIFTILNSSFLQSGNLLEIVRSMSSLAIVALGLSLVIIIGEIDLSIGATYGFGAMVLGELWNGGTPLWLAIVAALGASCGVGVVNAALITLAGIPAFIVTLGTMNFLQGLTLYLSKAQQVSPAFSDHPPPAGELKFFTHLGATNLPLGIPIQVAWMLGIGIAMVVLLHKSLFGFRLIAMGGNPQAARLSWLPVRRYKWTVFIICSLLAGIAGILDFSFLGSTDPNSGVALTFPVFAAVIIGGASLTGGKGTVVGTLSGALLLALLNNGLTVIGVGSYVQLMFVGSITIGAVAIDRLSARRVQQHD